MKFPHDFSSLSHTLFCELNHVLVLLYSINIYGKTTKVRNRALWGSQRSSGQGDCTHTKSSPSRSRDEIPAGITVTERNRAEQYPRGQGRWSHFVVGVIREGSVKKVASLQGFESGLGFRQTYVEGKAWVGS